MIKETLPTRTEAAWFQFRAACFRLKRGVMEWNGRAPKRLARERPRADARRLAESRTVLFNSASPAEFALQAGKVHNLRLAARRLNGIIISAGQTFSFWKNLGRATRRRGFVAGRELREGCVIPNIGGGLCQLSNALYDVALRSGCEIVERHAHSQRLPGSITAPGRDATIFWNYVDLRFRPLIDCQLQVQLSRGELTVALDSLRRSEPPIVIAPPATAACETRVDVAETCETCGVAKCFRNPAAVSLPRHGITAWLLDSFAPEFDQWIAENRDPRDAVFVPLRTGRVAAYRWDTAGFATVQQAGLTTLQRSLRSRRLAAQGAERQRTLLEFDGRFARSFAQRLPYVADHVVVSQNLLPHLWRSGDLGGRTFDVLMTRLPIADLERTLDAAAARYRESRTLADYRAPPEIREAETEALAAARFWLTPHSGIAALGQDRAIKLDWNIPQRPRPFECGQAIVFPATTLARKGCYEMREVARTLGLKLRIAGPVIESPDFWGNIAIDLADDWIQGAGLVVLPAWIEHWPRRLLRAVSAGVPVIASEACGLGGLPEVTEIPAGDGETLRKRIEEAVVRIPT